MQAVFLSDVHIRDHNDPNLSPLIAFLESLAGKVDRLFIVGDLFDTWFDFPRAVFSEYVPLLSALHSLRRAGTEIVYVTGNHDFEMGHYIRNILGVEVHDTEMTLEVDGRRAYVAHGDMVNAEDRNYRLLRRILRAGVTRWLAHRLGPGWIWRIGRWLSATDKGGHTEAHRSLVSMFRAYAERRFDEGFSTVVLGHLHIPAFERAGEAENAHTYVNLGDWMQWRTFLRWEDGLLSMKQWAWPEGVEKDFAPPQSEAE